MPRSVYEMRGFRMGLTAFGNASQQRKKQDKLADNESAKSVMRLRIGKG